MMKASMNIDRITLHEICESRVFTDPYLRIKTKSSILSLYERIRFGDVLCSVKQRGSPRRYYDYNYQYVHY